MTHRAATIETARLILRPFNSDDFDDLYAYQSRPDVARYLHWEARDRAQVQRALEEDLGRAGDITSMATIPEKTQAHAVLVARQAAQVNGRGGIGGKRNSPCNHSTVVAPIEADPFTTRASFTPSAPMRRLSVPSCWRLPLIVSVLAVAVESDSIWIVPPVLTTL